MPVKTRMRPSICAVDLADAPDMFKRPLLVQAVGHGQKLGVVGDGDVAVAARQGSLGHFADGVVAVCCRGVHVQVTAQVTQLDQARQRVRGAALSISPRFSRNSGGIQSMPNAV